MLAPALDLEEVAAAVSDVDAPTLPPKADFAPSYFSETAEIRTLARYAATSRGVWLVWRIARGVAFRNSFGGSGSRWPVSLFHLVGDDLQGNADVFAGHESPAGQPA